MISMAIGGLAFGLIMFFIGGFILEEWLSIYTVKVKGVCIESYIGIHRNIQRFRYVIDGIEYEGHGRCATTKRRGKTYNLRVNKDNLESFVTLPYMLWGVEFGLFFIITSIIELALGL